MTGISEGAAYGDDAEMSSNYPIVKLSAGGLSWYATTSNWTPGVADDSYGQTAQFTLPPNLPAGTYSLTVIANGIASNPISFTPDISVSTYADTDWGPNGPEGTLPLGTTVLPGGVIGVNCFDTVQAAIDHASAGGTVFVYGYDGTNSASGDFTEDVDIDVPVALSFQRGAVTFDSLSGGAGATVDQNGYNFTVGDSTNTNYSGAISGGGVMTVVGGGTLTVTGSVAPLGGLTISDGEFQLDSAVAAMALQPTTVSIGANGKLDLSQLPAGTPVYLGGLSGGGDLNVLGFSVTVGTDNANATYSGNLSSTVQAGSFEKVGTGTLTLDGSDAAYSTAVENGTLLVNGSLGQDVGLAISDDGLVVLGPGAGNALGFTNVTVGNTAGITNLDVHGVSAATIGGLAGGAGAINLGACALSVGQNNNASDFFEGGVNGSGSLTKIGSGRLALYAPSSGSGITVGVTIAAGFVAAGTNGGTSADALADSTVTVGPVGPLIRVSGSVLTVNLGGLEGTGTVNVGSATLAVGGDNATTEFDGPLTAGALTKVGSGTLTLTGTNSYSGATTITSGTLQAGNGGTAGVLPSGAILDNGTLAYDLSNTATLPNAVSGTGSFAQIGTGRLILTGADTYTGTTSVSAGVLEVDGSLGTTAAPAGTVTVASGATLQGTGTINAPVVVTGTLEAGTATVPGMQTIDDPTATYALTLNGTLNVRINSPTVYDQVAVTGNVILGSNPNMVGPRLNVTVNYTPADGAQFDIIDIGGAYSRVGTFGEPVVDFEIGYTGGTPNKDVVLTWFGLGGGGD